MANSEAGDNDDFAIHVDDSCLTDSTDVQKPAQRSLSENTVIHTDQCVTDVEKDEHTEALIQAAARDIIEKIEQEAYEKKHGQHPSHLSFTEDGETVHNYAEESDLAFGQETELTHEDGTEMSYEGEEGAYEGEAHDDGYDGSASEHHEDDVFSHGRTPSGGSNNSSDAQNTDEEARYHLTKEIAEEVERQQAATQEAQREGEPKEDSDEQGFFDQSYDDNDTPMVSRVTSAATTTFQHSLHPDGANTHHLSPFHQSTAMRALQMSSPAPSLFSSGSPMPRKRPSSSRSATTQKPSAKTAKVTPVFAARPDPLVLLHINVLPLRWPHADIIENAPNDVLSKELLAVKQGWKVLKDKLGDMVLKRGVLIPHPQDSFETLDERLCGALELPHRPRAKILDCGHYLGPADLLVDDISDTSSCDFSDDEDIDSEFQDAPASCTWCDVCEKDVRFGKFDKLNRVPRKKTFKVKVYASNGLMGSGAWAACWRQMEEVDVEIEPAVEPGFNMQISELFDMAMATRQAQEDAYEEMESPQIVVEEPQIVPQDPGSPVPTYREATRPSTAVTVNEEPAYMETRSFESPRPPSSLRMLSPEPFPQPIIALPVDHKIRQLEDEVRRIEMEEARNREIYSMDQKQAPSRSESRQQTYQEEQQYRNESRNSRSDSRMSNRSSTRRAAKAHVDEDSFLELLLAAARVLLSDTKNLIIGFLGLLVVVFALRSGHGGGTSGMVPMSAVAERGQQASVFETPFQRQEAAMLRLQMEGVGMRGREESAAHRAAAAHHMVRDPYVAFAEEGRRAESGMQQVPVAPVAPIHHVPVVPVEAAHQMPVVYQAKPVVQPGNPPLPPPPPAQQIVEEAAPPIPAVRQEPVADDSVAVIKPGTVEVGAEVPVPKADVQVLEFAIPTPPARIRELEVGAEVYIERG